MALLTRLVEGWRSFWGGGERSFWIGEIPCRDPALARYLGGGGAAAAGLPVSEWTALNYSAYWAGVQAIAGSIASLPLFPYRRLPNGGKERYLRSPLYCLLHAQFHGDVDAN